MVTDNKSNIKTYFSFLLPSILGMVVISAYTFTDTFVVGYALGRIGLSAIGIGTPVLLLQIALGYLFGEGGGAAYSILIGAGDNKRARQIFTESMMSLILVSIIFMAFGIGFIEPISYFLGASAENISYVLDYNKYILYFSPIIMLNMAIGGFMRNDSKPKIAMIATAVGSISNIVLDILFVIVFNGGMAGASIATCLGSCISLAVNVGYIYIKKRNLRVTKVKPNYADLKRIMSNGFGPFVMEFSVAVVNIMYNIIAFKYYSELGISTYTIVQNWHLIGFNLIVGVGQGTQPLISLNHGKGDISKEKIFRKYGLISCLFLGSIFLFTWIFGAESLASVFVTNDVELLELGTLALKIVSCTYVFLALTIMLSYYYLGTEKTLQSMIINLSRGFVFPAILVFLMPVLAGKVGVWISIPLAECLSAVVAIVLFFISNYTERHPKQTTLIEPPLEKMDKN